MSITDGSVEYEIRTMPSTNDLGYRQPNTSYSIGDIAYHKDLPTGWYLECITAGITSINTISSTHTIDSTLSDGTVTWKIRSEQTNKFPIYNASILGDAADDLNDCKNVGLYRFFNSLNTPNGGETYGTCLTIFKSGDSDSIVAQIAMSMIEQYSNLYIRQCAENVWYPWKRLAIVNEIIDSISIDYNGAQGYVKFGSLLNNLIIQWGSKSNVIANTETEITFPISFTGSCQVFYTVVRGYNITTAYPIVKSIGGTKEKDSFICSENANYVTWFAIGK